ncbi:MAG: zinc ribbon domain-containing protein [Acidobacteriota bacterium]
MPIYEYICPRCEEKFEKLVLKVSSEVSCPRCGRSDVEKLFSSFATVGRPKGQEKACGSCKSKNCSVC